MLHLQVSQSVSSRRNQKIVRQTSGKTPCISAGLRKCSPRKKSIHRERCSKYFVFSAPPYAGRLFAHLGRRPSCMCACIIKGMYLDVRIGSLLPSFSSSFSTHYFFGGIYSINMFVTSYPVALARKHAVDCAGIELIDDALYTGICTH